MPVICSECWVCPLVFNPWKHNEKFIKAEVMSFSHKNLRSCQFLLEKWWKHLKPFKIFHGNPKMLKRLSKEATDFVSKPPATCQLVWLFRHFRLMNRIRMMLSDNGSRFVNQAVVHDNNYQGILDWQLRWKSLLFVTKKLGVNWLLVLEAVIQWRNQCPANFAATPVNAAVL